ncbi:MAG: sigma-54 dependent transcriptional regulator [Ignavibacteriaceae bacterium]|nr:sigma-54 dependent transcriptional regulator [Ignavibacteriaceae bacterium]
MYDNNLKIKLYSDFEDITSISGAIKQIQLTYPSLEFQWSSNFKVEADEIIILQIKTVDSDYFNSVLDEQDNISNKIIFAVPENDAVLVSTLAKLGFSEIFVLPYELFKFVNYIKEVIENNTYITSSAPTEVFAESSNSFEVFIGECHKIEKLKSVAKKIAARYDLNILITGETGTGKGVLAKAIHQFGKSKDAPFVEIMCVAVPEALIESELFGYEPGAFTSAKTRKLGLLELAENGTIFLDEIGELNKVIQGKLLRTLEKRIVRRLGGTSDIPLKAKIISATSRNLQSMIEEGSFRNDLFHRLYVVSLDIPPLRDRGEDIILLVMHFINEYNLQFGKKVRSIEPALKSFFLEYEWPGNVRELKNSIERAVLLGDGKKLKLSQFSFLAQKVKFPLSTKTKLPATNLHLNVDYKNIDLRTLSEMYAVTVLKREGKNKSETAKLLGISRPKLDSLLNKKNLL